MSKTFKQRLAEAGFLVGSAFGGMSANAAPLPSSDGNAGNPTPVISTVTGFAPPSRPPVPERNVLFDERGLLPTEELKKKRLKDKRDYVEFERTSKITRMEVFPGEDAVRLTPRNAIVLPEIRDAIEDLPAMKKRGMWVITQGCLKVVPEPGRPLSPHTLVSALVQTGAISRSDAIEAIQYLRARIKVGNEAQLG